MTASEKQAVERKEEPLFRLWNRLWGEEGCFGRIGTEYGDPRPGPVSGKRIKSAGNDPTGVVAGPVGDDTGHDCRLTGAEQRRGNGIADKLTEETGQSHSEIGRYHYLFMS